MMPDNTQRQRISRFSWIVLFYMFQAGNKQFWLLLDLCRHSAEQLPPQVFAIQLFNVVTSTTRILEHTFEVNHHYVFQLWPCSPDHKEAINIEIAAIDNSTHSVKVIATAQPLVTYCLKGQTYKFYAADRATKLKDQQLVLHFKIIQRKNLQKNLQTEQLRRINSEMNNYLRTCKEELQSYQQFLSFTNHVLQELNQPEPPKHPELHLHPRNLDSFPSNEQSSTNNNPGIEQPESNYFKRKERRLTKRSPTPQLSELSVSLVERPSSGNGDNCGVEVTEKQLPLHKYTKKSANEASQAIGFPAQQPQKSPRGNASVQHEIRPASKKRRAKTMKSSAQERRSLASPDRPSQTSQFTGSNKLLQPAHTQLEANQIQSSGIEPSSSRRSKTQQNRDQSVISVKPGGSTLSKYLYLSHRMISQLNSKRPQEPIPEEEQAQQESSTQSPPVEAQLQRLEQSLLENKTSREKGLSLDQFGARQQLQLTIRKRREEYRKQVAVQQQQLDHSTMGRQDTIIASQQQQSQEIQQSLRLSGRTGSKASQKYQPPKNLTTQRVVQIVQHLKPEQTQHIIQKEPSTGLEICNSSGLSLFPEIPVDRSFAENSKPSISRQLPRRKKGGKVGINRQASVIGSETDFNIAIPSQMALPAQDDVKQLKGCFDLKIWEIKATIYKFSEGQSKRCQFTIQSKTYQTELSVSRQSETGWKEKIIIKHVREPQMLSICLLSTGPSSPKITKQASSKVSVLKLLNCKLKFLRVYLYHNELAIGFLDFRFDISVTDRKRTSSLPEIASKREEASSCGYTLLPGVKKSTPEVEAPGLVQREGYQSRVRQAKRSLFPRLK